LKLSELVTHASRFTGRIPLLLTVAIHEKSPNIGGITLTSTCWLSSWQTLTSSALTESRSWDACDQRSPWSQTNAEDLHEPQQPLVRELPLDLQPFCVVRLILGAHRRDPGVPRLTWPAAGCVSELPDDA
jgi:hypothetical protein